MNYNTSPELFRAAQESYRERRIFLVVVGEYVVAGSDGIVARFEDEAAAIKCLTDAGYVREEGIENIVFRPKAPEAI